MDVIMDSVAETRDRLNRLGQRGDGETGPSSRPTSRRCHHGKLSRNCQLCELERKIESLDRLCSRQSAILTGVAIALRGEPDETSAWSHHDLVERVRAVMDESKDLRGELEDLRRQRQQALNDAQFLAVQTLAREATGANDRDVRRMRGAVWLTSQLGIMGPEGSREDVPSSELSSLSMRLNRLVSSGIGSAKWAAHARRGYDRLVQHDGAGRSVEPGVAEREDATIRGHKPVTQ